MSVYQEWLNSNAHRAYPFKEDTALNATNDTSINLPKYLFVDFIMTVVGAADITVRLSQLSYAGGFLTAVFTDAANTIVTTLTVNTNTHTANTAYPLVGQGDYEDARGKVVLGTLTTLASDLPDGIYTFLAELEPCTVRPDIRGVRSLQVGVLDNMSSPIGGIVKLLEGTNIRLTYLPEVNGIRIDAIAGDGLNETVACTDGYELPQPVRFVNGRTAQDINIEGDGKCIEVTTNGNVITIRDKCSQPCCGCNELEFITTNMQLLQSTISRLEPFAQLLNSKLINMGMVITLNEKGSV